ncbi:MAG TPA: hypothetical protein PLJ38_06340, partial [bacterium]|nr:hypothetical protein [bacterium]
MKIALINPSTKIRLTDKLEKYIIRAGSRWPHSGVKKIGTIPHYLPLPFFLGYAASLLEKFGHSVFVFDFVALDYSESEMLDELKKTEPDIIFFEPTVLTIDFDMKLIDNLKKTGITKTIILAGAYATVFAAELLQKNPNIDFIIKGEYEKKLLDLVNAI